MPDSTIPEIYRDDPNIIFVDPEKVEPDALLKTQSGMDVLDMINRRVGSAGDSVDDILTFVFEETRTLFQCDRISLAFLTDNDERVTSYSVVSDYEPMNLKKGYSEDIRGSSLEFILKSGKTRIIKDFKLYAEKHPSSRSTTVLLKEGVRSNLTSPLMVDDRIVGLLFRSSKKKNAYSLDHVHTHLALADRLGQVVEKAYRIEQLKAAMNSYLEMLGFVSHEIKSPISTIIMDCKMMMDGYYGEINEKAMGRIKRIVTRGEHLMGMVKEYLDLSRIEGGELKLRTYEDLDLVKRVIVPMIEMQESSAENNEMVIKVNTPPQPVIIKGDPGLLGIVMTNLLSNAIKYGDKKGDIEVDLVSTDQGIRLSVTNDGPGFPKSEIPNLFKKFSRIQTPELIKRKGTGVGLYTVWRVIKLHGGKIKAESEEGSWARFIIDLPVSSNQ